MHNEMSSKASGVLSPTTSKLVCMWSIVICDNIITKCHHKMGYYVLVRYLFLTLAGHI